MRRWGGGVQPRQVAVMVGLDDTGSLCSVEANSPAEAHGEPECFPETIRLVWGEGVAGSRFEGLGRAGIPSDETEESGEFAARPDAMLVNDEERGALILAQQPSERGVREREQPAWRQVLETLAWMRGPEFVELGVRMVGVLLGEPLLDLLTGEGLDHRVVARRGHAEQGTIAAYADPACRG